MNILSKLFPKNHNILIVDDIEDNVSLLESYLEKINGLKIYKSYNPLDAIETIKTVDFSLLLLDIQMTNIDGYELATKIKYGEYGRNINTPIIFVTAIYSTNKDKMKGYNIGSIDYIVKPIDKSIIEKVKKYLQHSNDVKSNNFYISQRIDNIKKSINI